MKKSLLEELFLRHIEDARLPLPETEYRFHPVRRWRFDLAFPHLTGGPLAVEIEGGTWMRKSRHTSGAGFAKDAEKYNEAALLGWRVLRFTTDMVQDGRAIAMLVRAFQVW